MVKDFNEQIEDKTSRINAAGLINSTLERLWMESYMAMSTGNYLLWNIKLDSIWAILGGDVKEDDEDDKKFNEITLKIYKAGSLKSKVGSGFVQTENPNNPVQYVYLLQKALFLRRLQNKQGKGTAYQNEDDDDFD